MPRLNVVRVSEEVEVVVERSIAVVDGARPALRVSGVETRGAAQGWLRCERIGAEGKPYMEQHRVRYAANVCKLSSECSARHRVAVACELQQFWASVYINVLA